MKPDSVKRRERGQYAATLGRWFGASDSQLLELFPNLANFDAGKRNLGFMA